MLFGPDVIKGTVLIEPVSYLAFKTAITNITSQFKKAFIFPEKVKQPLSAHVSRFGGLEFTRIQSFGWRKPNNTDEVIGVVLFNLCSVKKCSLKLL